MHMVVTWRAIPRGDSYAARQRDHLASSHSLTLEPEEFTRYPG